MKNYAQLRQRLRRDGAVISLAERRPRERRRETIIPPPPEDPSEGSRTGGFYVLIYISEERWGLGFMRSNLHPRTDLTRLRRAEEDPGWMYLRAKGSNTLALTSWGPTSYEAILQIAERNAEEFGSSLPIPYTTDEIKERLRTAIFHSNDLNL